jgi:hypothetical protein
MLAQDLEAQIARSYDEEQRNRLRGQLDSVRRDQAYDRHASPRSKRGKVRGR